MWRLIRIIRTVLGLVRPVTRLLQILWLGCDSLKFIQTLLRRIQTFLELFMTYLGLLKLLRTLLKLMWLHLGTFKTYSWSEISKTFFLNMYEKRDFSCLFSVLKITFYQHPYGKFLITPLLLLRSIYLCTFWGIEKNIVHNSERSSKVRHVVLHHFPLVA